MTPSITDFDIQAFVDDELNGMERKRVGRFIQKHPWAYKRWNELQMQKEILKQCFVSH